MYGELRISGDKIHNTCLSAQRVMLKSKFFSANLLRCFVRFANPTRINFIKDHRFPSFFHALSTSVLSSAL